jgi:hypothetical protein
VLFAGDFTALTTMGATAQLIAMGYSLRTSRAGLSSRSAMNLVWRR